MAKQQHVPETKTTEVKPNREQRRHPEKLQQVAEDETLSRDRATQADIVEQSSQEVQSVRAKNSGHGKKTADKWNQ
jgi:hypothetical protein